VTSDSDSDEEDRVPAVGVPRELNFDQEESKADGGLVRSRAKGAGNSKKHLGYVDYKGFQEAVEELELAQTSNGNIQSYRDQHPYDPLVK
jgi:hypothetical protein